MARGAAPALPALLALAFLVAAAAPVRAQSRGDLDRALQRIANSWERGNAAGVLAHAGSGPVALDLGSDRTGRIAPRQAAAALQRVFDQRETTGMRVEKVDVMAGSPPRAYGELSWASRMLGTTIPERVTVFLGFEGDGRRWRLTQIRLMP